MNEDELTRLYEKLNKTIAAIDEIQESNMPENAFEAALAILQSRRDKLKNQIAVLKGSGAIATGEHSTAIGERGIGISGNSSAPVITGNGNTIIITETDTPVHMPAYDRKSAMGRYLENIIGNNRHLRLQGIRSGGKLVHIELDQIYITLRAGHPQAGS